MADQIKVALVGAGNMANTYHYPSLSEFEDVKIVGLCDLVEEKLNATADKFKIERRFTDYRKMIEETAPQAIYILMPPHQLHDIVTDCLDRGLHLFMEKPPGITADQTRQMAYRAEDSGSLTMVGFNRRYIPLMRQCRKLVFDKCTSPNQVVASFHKWHEPAAPYYNGAIDILTSDAIHALDAMRWMAAAEVKQLGAVVRDHGQRMAMSWNALCHFENDCVGVFMANWRTGGRRHQFEMHGEGISVYCNPDDRALIFRDGAAEPEIITTQEAAGSDQPYKYSGFYGESRHFIDCLKHGREPESCLPDAVKTMELADRVLHTGL